MLMTLTVWILTSCGKLLKRWECLTNLICLLRNQYVGQEETVRTKYNWLVQDGGKVEVVKDFLFPGSKITADGNCSLEIRRRLFIGRKTMTNLDSVLESRDVTLLTEVCIL